MCRSDPEEDSSGPTTARSDRPPTTSTRRCWPVLSPGETEPGDVEESGIYLYPDRFGGGAGRAGGTILVIAQGSVLINVRAD